MIITVERKIFHNDCTLGNLYIDDKWYCHTLEDVVRNKIVDKITNFIKIFGKTAIPYGKYEIIVNYSNKFKRLLPLLLNVPFFTGIRLHYGRSSLNSLGCILVSKKSDNSKKQLLFDNKEAQNFITNLIAEKQKTEKIFIIIK